MNPPDHKDPSAGTSGLQADAKDRPPSRRAALNIVGAGLAAAPVLLAGGAAHAQTAVPGAVRARRPLQDPRNLYPRPPFAPQTQPWPGLASRMNPRPDHGFSL